MSLLQQALDYIGQNNPAGFFAFIEKHIPSADTQKRFLLNRLRNAFQIEGMKVDTAAQLETFARTVFPQQGSPSYARFLTYCAPPTHFVGRQGDLETLHTHLRTALPTVLVNGLGGVGKTTLARQYAFVYQAYYTHIVWIEQTSTLISAFILAEELTEDLKFSNESELDRFKAVMHYLETLTGDNLLIVDNYARTDTDIAQGILTYLPSARLQHWKILFTSREQMDKYKVMRLDTLPETDAIALFHLHAGKKHIDTAALQTLLQLIGYHTLTIELLAKNYALSMDLERVEDLIQLLTAKAIDSALLQELIRIGANEAEIRLYGYLLQIFNITPLPEEALHLLRQFAVLPSLPVAGKQLLDWIGDTERKYKPALQLLTAKGWLTTEDNLAYEMHRLVQMLLLKVLQPTIIDCEPLYVSLKDLLDKDKVQANPLAHQWLAEYAEALLANLHFAEKPIQKGYLQERLARLYEVLGNYTQAEQYYQAALQATKETLGTKHSNYAIALNNLALLYKTQGKYTEAAPLYQEALQIDKETIGIKHPDYAIDLNNLAGLYNAQGKYTQAEPLYQEALQIDRETIGTKHPDYAIHLNNLAGLYDAQGKYTQAEPLYQEALQIDRETLGVKHPDYAIDLHNLGSMYYEMGQYEKAQGLLTEAYQIRLAALGETHPDTQSTKEWLALVEAKL